MKKKTIWKRLLVALTFLTAINFSTAAQAEWKFGIGTGFLFMNAEGDQGFQVRALDTPIEFELELDPDDFSDLTESAFGFAGFASDGNWTIQYSYSNLDLEGDDTVVGPGGLTNINFSVEFEMTGAELVVGYAVYRNNFITLRPYIGVRYTEHELTGTVTTTGAINDQRRRKIDEDWTDVLIGFMADVHLAQNWDWNTRVDGGFGGSEGTYFVSTGVTWQFAKHWSATFYGRYSAVDFENSNKGDDDWYLYDVDESGVGINIMFIW